MIDGVTATIECRWLVEPSLAVVAIGLGLVSAAAGWMWGGRAGGIALPEAARRAGFCARLGILVWLAAAVAGVSWRPGPLPAASISGVLDASLTLPPVAWPGDSVEIEVTLATGRIDPADLVVEAMIDGPTGAAPRRVPLAIEAEPPASRPLPAPSASRPPTALVTRSRGRAVLERPGRRRVVAQVVESTPARPDRRLTRSGLIDVIEGPVSVLVIDSRPRFETRFLDQCLSRDGRIDHRLHLQPRADSGDTSGRFPQDAPLPTGREDWNRYDCVVLGGIDPDLAPEESWTALAEAVSQDGLGVIWALDGRCDLEAIHASPLRRLAPVTGSCRPPGEPASRPLVARPAPAGPIPWWLSWQTDEGSAAGPWRFFGPVYDVVHPVRMRPTARISAVFEGADHPPAILEDRLGRGRIIAFLSETWRWRATLAGADTLGAVPENAAAVDAIWRRAILTVAAPHLAEPEPTLSEPAAAAADLSHDPAAPVGGRADAGRPIWRHPLAFLAFLAIAAAEWWLRARGGLA